MAFHPTLSKSGRIMFWPLIKFTEFMGNHFPETLLKIRYRYVFKEPLNLKNPFRRVSPRNIKRISCIQKSQSQTAISISFFTSWFFLWSNDRFY